MFNSDPLPLHDPPGVSTSDATLAKVIFASCAVDPEIRSSIDPNDVIELQVNEPCLQVSLPDVSLASLNYTAIDVDGIDDSNAALVDGGSQINCIDSRLVQHMQLSPFDSINIKGFVGSPIRASLVTLNIRLTNRDSSNDSDNEYMPVVFAACDLLNEGIILTLPIADQLSDSHLSHISDT